MAGGAISSLVKVTINGADLDKTLDAALGESWVEASVNLPAAFHLTFRDPKRLLLEDYAAQLMIGAPVGVYAVAAGQGKDVPLVTGYITALEVERAGNRTTTVVRGLDHAFKMLRQRRTRGWRNMSASEIVAKLATLDGVAIAKIEPSREMYPLLTQANVSDWEFVNQLADMSDMTVDFDDLGLLRFRKPERAATGVVVGNATQDPFVIEFGSNIRRMRSGITAVDQVASVTTRGWDADRKNLLTGTALAVTNPDFAIDTTPGEAVATTAFKPAKLTETATPYGSQSEVDQAAKTLADDITSAFAEVEVEMRGEPKMRPGLVVRLKDLGTPFEGRYTVSTTRHTFGDDNVYRTWVAVTGRQVRTLYGLSSGGLRSAQRIHGVVNAIVTDIRDPKKQGRVKVRFPWFDDDYVTLWARTLQYGGVGGGGVISPEVNDEVLVAFDRGVMDYPYVLGGLYSDVDRPSEHDVPLNTAGHLNRRSLESRTGHRLELLDAETKKGVRLRNGADTLTVFLDQTETTITISSDGKVDIGGKGQVSVHSDAELQIRAPKINVEGDVTIEGTLTMIGPAAFAGEVNIIGNTSIEGAVEITGETTVTGNENVVGVLSINSTPIPIP